MIKRHAFVLAIVLLFILAGMVLARDMPAEGSMAYPPDESYPVATATRWPTVTPLPTVLPTPLPPPPPAPKPKATALPAPDGLPYFPDG